MATPQVLATATVSYQFPQARTSRIDTLIGCHGQISYSARSWIVNAVSGLVPMLLQLMACRSIADAFEFLAAIQWRVQPCLCLSNLLICLGMTLN